MRLPIKLRDVPGRAVAGAYVLHSGVEKMSADPEHAAGIHGMAAGTYPFLAKLPPEKFTRALGVGEMAVGAVLLTPLVPTAVAGLALAGFAAALTGVYARTPGMRRPGSIWPSQAGIGLSKDVWLLAMGAGFVADALVSRRNGWNS